MSHHKKKGALARRYGHSMAQVHSAIADVRKLAADNPIVTAGLVGAGAGAVIAGMSATSAAVVGAVAAVGIEEATKRK